MSYFWLSKRAWRKAVKSHDTLLTVLVFDPLVRLCLPLLLKLGITPNMATLSRLAIAVMGAAAFAVGRLNWGASAFVVWYVLDCVDGKLARLTHCASVFGEWMDRISDRLGVGLLGLSLSTWLVMSGQSLSGLLATLVIFLWFLRCMNSDRLGWIKQEEAALTGKVQSGSVAHEVTTSAGWLVAIMRRLKSALARTRITGFVLHDVEWLTLAWAIAPLTGEYRLCFVIACSGMMVQTVLHTVIFWKRRRTMVTLGRHANTGKSAHAIETAPLVPVVT